MSRKKFVGMVAATIYKNSCITKKGCYKLAGKIADAIGPIGDSCGGCDDKLCTSKLCQAVRRAGGAS